MVSVTFTQISEDDPGDCHNNFLKLYDGPDTSSLGFNIFPENDMYQIPG